MIYQGEWGSNKTLCPICFRAGVGVLWYKIITSVLITRMFTVSRSNPHVNLHKTFASFSFFMITFWCLRGGKIPLILKRRGKGGGFFIQFLFSFSFLLHFFKAARFFFLKKEGRKGLFYVCFSLNVAQIQPVLLCLWRSHKISLQLFHRNQFECPRLGLVV